MDNQLIQMNMGCYPILSSDMHQEKLSLPFEIDAAWAVTHQVVAVLTGGTEQKFQQLVEAGVVSLDKPVYLQASGQSNSLAASLEILCWIQQQGGSGSIIVSSSDCNRPLPIAKRFGERVPDLSGEKGALRLGVIGKPSDWLIASQVDYDRVRLRLGIELVDIPIERVTSLGEVDGGVAGAERIYERLKELVTEYRLDGLTLRCFDLLSTVKNTGCLALSHLNDEGIPAACEGDIPLLLTMILCRRVTGQPGFQVNPARIEADGRMLWAHCTLPLTMTDSHSLTTHFESGIGVGIHGELPLGDYTLVKLSADLNELLAEDVELVANQYEPNLCRTQVWLQGSPALSERLLTHPIANHHLLIRGHHAHVFVSIKYDEKDFNHCTCSPDAAVPLRLRRNKTLCLHGRVLWCRCRGRKVLHDLAGCHQGVCGRRHRLGEGRLRVHAGGWLLG